MSLHADRLAISTQTLRAVEKCMAPLSVVCWYTREVVQRPCDLSLHPESNKTPCNSIHYVVT